MEEVQRCLQELGDSIDSQKQVEEALGIFFSFFRFFVFSFFLLFLRLHIGYMATILICSRFSILVYKKTVIY